MIYTNPKTNEQYDVPDEQKDDASKFLNAGFIVTPSGPGIGEALARGGAQGLSSGFSDEIAAKISTAGQNEEEFKKRLQEFRASDERARAAHPAAYTVGDVGGSIIPSLAAVGATIASGGAASPALAPTVGASAAKIGGAFAAKNLGKVMLQGALQGGISGAGFGNKLGTGESALPDVAGGSLLGGAIGAGGRVLGSAAKISKGAIGKAISSVKDAGGKTASGNKKSIIDSAINKIGSMASGAPEEAVSNFRENPRLINDLIEKGATKHDIVKEIYDDISSLDDLNAITGKAVREVTGKSKKTINPMDLQRVANEKIEIIKREFGSGREEAIKELNFFKKQISDRTANKSGKSYKMMPMSEAHDLLQSLGSAFKKTGGQTAAEERVRGAVKSLYGDVRDLMATAEPEFGILNTQISERKKLLENTFGAITNDELRDKTRIESMINQISRGKLAAIDRIAPLEEKLGKSYVKNMRDVWTAQQMSREIPETGASMKVPGALIGEGLGGLSSFADIGILRPMGIAGGALFGAIKDKYGSGLTRRVMSWFAKQPVKTQNEIKTKIGGVPINKQIAIINSYLANSQDKDKPTIPNAEIPPALTPQEIAEAQMMYQGASQRQMQPPKPQNLEPPTGWGKANG
jgi:hypothetical protein